MTTKNSFLAAILLGILFIQTTTALSFKGISANPADPSITDPAHFLYEAKPGTVIADAIKVSNSNATPINIRIYAVETEINNQKDEVFKPYTGTKTHLASWITFSEGAEENVNLEPGEVRDVKFTITIPDYAEKKKFKGGIMVEEMDFEEKTIQESVVVKTNGRLGIGASLVVTDTPQTIAKLSDGKPLPWQTYYLIGSGVLFALILVIMFIQLRRKKRLKHSKQ